MRSRLCLSLKSDPRTLDPRSLDQQGMDLCFCLDKLLQASLPVLVQFFSIGNLLLSFSEKDFVVSMIVWFLEQDFAVPMIVQFLEIQV